MDCYDNLRGLIKAAHPSEPVMDDSDDLDDIIAVEV
jgi:hypothetical protein